MAPGAAGKRPLLVAWAGMESNEAFVELIRRHGDKAYNFAFRLTGNEADARDLVQDALLKAYRSRDRYDESRPFDSWLLKIMQNVYLDAMRREKPTVPLDAPHEEGARDADELLPARDESPAESALRAERDRALQRALDSLPAHYRAAVALCDIEGLSYEEISRVMTCPVGTVRSRVHQGRVLLKKAFEKLEGGH